MRPKSSKDSDSAPSTHILTESGHLYVAEIPLSAWTDIAPHPRQRNTERQCRKEHFVAARRATGAARQALRQVVAAKFQGRLYKVDGHARTHLWMQNELPPPETVIATVHRVESYDDLLDLYTVFDVQSAAESIYDRVYGAFRQIGLDLRSPRLKHGFIVGALNIALRGATRKDQDKDAPELNIYKAVASFKDELGLLDSVSPQPEVFFSGVVAAALIALSLEPEAVTFFERLAKRQGSKKEGLNDAVEALLVHVGALQKQRSSWVNAIQGDLCARTLSALSAWQAGSQSPRYWVGKKIEAVDIMPYIVEMKRTKGIASDPEL